MSSRHDDKMDLIFKEYKQKTRVYSQSEKEEEETGET
jgi:hypothetical protein